MEKAYKPIDCGYHDRLEAAASKRQRVSLVFLSPSGEAKNTTATIETIETSQGEEYLQLNTGESIRLDRIVKLNEETFPGHQKT